MSGGDMATQTPQIVEFPSIRRAGQGGPAPARFHERFGADNHVLDPAWPRITTQVSEASFAPRRDGLRVLLINAPIREWSYPNILPIGHAYVAAVAAMDGHTIDVLDLNAERKQPVKSSPEAFIQWVESRVTETLERQRPDVIGLGGIITQYSWIRRIARLCRSVHPDVPIVLGGGIASSMPEFMVRRLGVDAVVQEEGEITFSELLHRLERRASLEGVKGVAYRHLIRPGEWDVRNNGLRPSLPSRALGLDTLPWPLRSRWAEDEVYKINPVGHLNWQTKWIDGASVAPGQYSLSMIASRGCPYASKACDYAVAADTPILRADFSWTPASDLAAGDKILTVTEYPAGKDRRWTVATVQARFDRRAEGFSIETTGGNVVGSEEHPWLARVRGGRDNGQIRWVETRDLKVGWDLSMVAPPEEAPDLDSLEYRRGYIRGLFEGDGTFHKGLHRASGRMWPHARLALTDGEALDRFVKYCDGFGIRTKRGPFLNAGKKPMEKVWLSGVEPVNLLDEILQEPIDNRQSAAGYLAGMYDAEGTRYVSKHTAITRFCQRPGPVLERVLEAISMLKLPFVREKPRRSDGLVSVRLASQHGSVDTIRFFAMTRPAIMRKCSVDGLSLKSRWVTITAIRSVGDVRMIDLQTTARTFVAGPVISHNCYAAYLGKTYRLRSPREVVDEMEYLKQRYGAAYIHFLDDLLMTDYRWALEFVEALRERKRTTGFEVLWGGTCRTNIVADDVIRAKREGRPHMLEQAWEVGMRQAGYGVESASPTILKNIDKSGQTLEKMEIAIQETQRVLGYADCSFMIGSPGESKSTVQETVDFCRKVGLKPEVFFFTTAYPGTSFWDLAMSKGLIRKAVTGQPGPADEDMVEQYFLRLGEQGEEVRTNFSDLPDQDVIDLSWWAVTELGGQNTVRHPHTGEQQKRTQAVRGASRADV
jgi:radical SAM superfamily enzyme YgiQ (UPF0313 family)